MSQSVNLTYGLFNDSYPPVMDGVTLTVVNYREGLVKRGNHVTVVTPRNPDSQIADDADVLNYFSLPIPSRRPYRYGYPKADFGIWRKLRTHPFALVHSHSPFSAGRLAVYSARKHSVPLVGTFHSKFRTDLEHSLPKWMVGMVLRRVIDFFDACDEVWIPQAQVEDTIREYGFKGPVTVVENGNDLVGEVPRDNLAEYKSKSRAKLGIGDSTMAMLFVGQHIRPKGVDVIIDALRSLPDAMDWRMDFIGTGYYAEEASQAIVEAGLSDKVTFHGVISDRDELREYYAAANLFLFPSMYDNAPLVVREAAAMGTPAVLPFGSTASEVVSDRVNGFICERSAEAYCRKIQELYSDRSLIDQAGLGARDSLTRSWDDVMDEVIDRYQHLIARYGNR